MSGTFHAPVTVNSQATPQLPDAKLIHAGVDPFFAPRFEALKTDGPSRLGTGARQFGALDFKLVNYGRVDSLVTQCQLDVVSFNPDETPDFTFRAQIERDHPRRLTLLGINNGWGGNAKMTIELREPALQQLFQPHLLQNSGDVVPSRSYRILTLDPTQIDQAKLQQLIIQAAAAEANSPDRAQAQPRRWWRRPRQTSPVRSLSLDLHARVQYSDSSGQIQERTFQVYNSDDNILPKLKPEGFTWGGYVDVAHMDSSGYYAVRLPPHDNSTQTFRLDQRIEPGGSDRFHIVLATERSGTFRVRVSFFLDGNSAPLRSDILELPLWCPRNVMPPPAVADGRPFRLVDGVLVLGGKI